MVSTVWASLIKTSLDKRIHGLAVCFTRLFLNSQTKVRGVRQLEEVSDGSDGGLSGEEGLGKLEREKDISLVLAESICRRRQMLNLPPGPAAGKPCRSSGQPLQSGKAWHR